jgi:predicted MFS family arabinose efflux permease
MTVPTQPNESGRFVIRENSVMAYGLLAFVASAGIFYVSAIPSIISALVDGVGFTAKQAGYAVSANGYGSMVGALIAVGLVRHLAWKKAVSTLFIFMIVIELVSTQITSPDVMLAWRFIAGLFGGCSVGFGLSVLARLSNPDRAYGGLLVLQFGMGGLIIYLRLIVEPYLGVAGVFVMLAILMGVSLLSVPFLGAYRPQERSRTKPSGLPPLTFVTVMTLLALFLYQASGNALWTYVERIGGSLGLNPLEVSEIVAWTTWAGVLGAIIPIVIGVRYGRLPLIVSAMVFSILSAGLLYVAEGKMLFMVGALVINLVWSYALAYLLGLSAFYDETGQLAALAGMASKFGIATGPLIAATLYTEGNFGSILLIAAIGFGICLLAAAPPARHADNLDRKQAEA